MHHIINHYTTQPVYEMRHLDIYIRGNCLELLKSYLHSRNQITKLNNTKSDIELIFYRVPQGLVLGPLLFLLYINDIINCSQDGEFVIFADYTNIFVSGNTKIE